MMHPKPLTVVRTTVWGGDYTVPEWAALTWKTPRSKLTRRQQIRLSARARKRRRGW